MKLRKNLLVIIPHSGIKRPIEIKQKWLSKYNKELIFSNVCETDRLTNELYNFKKFLGNYEIVFPYNQIYVNIIREPENINESVPIFIRGVPVYKEGFIPDLKFRKKLAKKYFPKFYNSMKKIKKNFIFNGHSTSPSHSSLGNEKLIHDIVLSNYMIYKNKKIKFAPDKYIKIYSMELKKRLPDLKIGINSVYTSVYDHVCFVFGYDKKPNVPVIHQETNERLYLSKDGKINHKKLNKLRKAFALAIDATMEYFE